MVRRGNFGLTDARAEIRCRLLAESPALRPSEPLNCPFCDRCLLPPRSSKEGRPLLRTSHRAGIERYPEACLPVGRRATNYRPRHERESWLRPRPRECAVQKQVGLSLPVTRATTRERVQSRVSLPIAVHESVKPGVPEPIGWNATNRTIVGHESVGLLLCEDSLGVEADASGMDYSSIWRRLDNGAALATTGDKNRDRRARAQVTLHVGATAEDGRELPMPKIIPGCELR